MSTTQEAPTSAARTADALSDRPTQGQDRAFRGLTTGSGVLILVTLAGVAFFLFQKSLPAFDLPADALPNADGIWDYTWPLLFGTVYAASIALLLATPLAIGIGLFISHYAPRRLAKVLGYVVDLLAAIPSVVYGLWGIFVLAPFFVPIYDFIARYLGFLPFFREPVVSSGRNMATAGIVLAVMILPIIASISREVFLQTPRLYEEAALALGATRWEVIRTAVLPHGKSGVIGGAMLGLGRALGETIAVALVLSAVPGLVEWALFGASNSSTIAANIALSFPNFGGVERSGLYFTGLVLFVATFVVNYVARRIAGKAGGY